MNSINFLKHTKIFFLISFLLLIPGWISLAVYGLNLSIDFTGGSLIEIETKSEVSTEKVKSVVEQNNISVSSVQSAGDNIYLIRTKPISQEENDQIKQKLNTELGGTTERRFETVGPTVGAELAQKAVFAIVLASLCIILYIAWSFRNIPKPYSSWKFGFSAVIALVHDASVVLGVFSLLGHYYNVEIDALFVTAILTVIGFSVHDTIVVFDRIRENLPKLSQSTFSEVVNYSLTETIGRSVNTSITVILTLLALLLFGGETTQWFIAALLIGIATGTYSSIFTAAPLLAIWEQANLKGFKSRK